LSIKGLSFSPIRGPEGNIEFLVWLQKAGSEKNCHGIDLSLSIQKVVLEAQSGTE
jgi:23S rRNA (cytidine1920-2'-O)/16S rRNA (cytidine1409-2'-O)-methyltransferase